MKIRVKILIKGLYLVPKIFKGKNPKRCYENGSGANKDVLARPDNLRVNPIRAYQIAGSDKLYVNPTETSHLEQIPVRKLVHGLQREFKLFQNSNAIYLENFEGGFVGYKIIVSNEFINIISQDQAQQSNCEFATLEQN